MKIADIILNYVYSHDRALVRSEFISWMSQNYPSISGRSIDTAIRSLLRSDLLNRKGYGTMAATEGQNVYIPQVGDDVRNIYKIVKEKYPYTRFCLWQPNVLSSFMQHVPDVDMIILETEKVAAEAVYEDLRQLEQKRKVFLKPTMREYELYAVGESCLIVRDLITESPTIDIDGIPMASLEKILVDAQVLPELEFARGSELYTIYENASEMYRINCRAMLRYASRRGRKEETEKLIKSTMK